MLNHFLRTVDAQSPIQYVGGYTQGFVGTTSNVNISLTSLTGGIASAPSAGDFVLVYFGTGSAVDRNLVVAGYTEVTELYSSDTFDANLAVAYKFMGSTPDTTVTLTGGTLSVEDAGAVYISVWRNVNTTSPFDVLFKTATGTNSVLCNPPAITPVSNGAYIVSGGAGAHSDGVDTYSSSNLTGFLSSGANDTSDVTIGGGYKQWTSGSFDPAAFTFSGTDSGLFSWAATTVALRPKNAPPDSLEFIASYTNVSVVNTSTGIIPAATEAGDLIVYWDFVPNWTSGAQPSGFTLANLGEVAAVDARVSYKIATSGDAGSIITGATGSDHAVAILVFRGTYPFTSATDVSWAGGEPPTNYSDNIPSTGLHIYLCGLGSRDGVPTPPFTSESPALQGYVATGGSAESLTIGYSLFVNNGVTQDVSVPVDGTRSIGQAGYITVT